jgi:thioredoxin 1
MTKSVDIQEVQFEEAVLKSKNPALVDFWAPRCAPCRLVEPVVDELADEYEGRVDFFKLNRDENPGIANRFGVMSLPTIMVFKNGRPMSSITGFTKETRREMRNNIDSVLL